METYLTLFVFLACSLIVIWLVRRGLFDAKTNQELCKIASHLSLEEAALALQEELAGLAFFEEGNNSHTASAKAYAHYSYTYIEVCTALFSRIKELKNEKHDAYERAQYRIGLSNAFRAATMQGSDGFVRLRMLKEYNAKHITMPNDNIDNRKNMEKCILEMKRLRK